MLCVDGEIDVPQVMHRQLMAPEIQFVDIGVGTPVITQRSVPRQSRRSPFRKNQVADTVVDADTRFSQGSEDSGTAVCPVTSSVK